MVVYTKQKKERRRVEGVEALEREKPLLDIADIEIDAFRRSAPSTDRPGSICV